MKTTSLVIGTRVRIATEHLRNTGQVTGPEAPTSVGPFASGTIVKLETMGDRPNNLATVEWDDGAVRRILVANLEPVGHWLEWMVRRHGHGVVR